MDFSDLREPISAWTHAAGLVLAVPGTLYLWWRARRARPAKRISLLIFGLSLAFCYGASMLFHGVRLPPPGIAVYDRLDRVGIFVLIAGTYTPLAWTLLRGWWRAIPLASVWLITAVATALLAAGGPLAPGWMTGLYLGMGWGVAACYAELARVVTHRALLPLIAGGVFYSVGAVLNVLRWPALWPGTFGPHELFHLFVLAGSLAHYYLILKVAVPFDPRATAAHPASAPGGAVPRPWFSTRAPSPTPPSARLNSRREP